MFVSMKNGNLANLRIILNYNSYIVLVNNILSKICAWNVLRKKNVFLVYKEISDSNKDFARKSV